VTTAFSHYASPLAARYASGAMLELWSPRQRHVLWRRLWLALAEAEHELGVTVITEEGLAQLRAHLDDIDFEKAAAFERRFRHDVMAHVHAFGDVAPLARPFLHLGATSAFVTDNADVILMRRGLELLRDAVREVFRELAGFAERWRDEPALAYTHLQPAQLTTVGKRATLWMQDLALDLADLDYRITTLPLRGVKGTTGTQASFLEMFHGDHAKVRRLEELVVQRMGFDRALPVTGQTYSRKLDAQVLGVVAGVAASAAKFAGDIRLLQSFGEIEEPFERGRMLYIQSRNRVYVLFNDTHSPAWLSFENKFNPSVDKESEESFVPPPNLFQPLRVIGFVWRGSDLVRNRLGLGTQEEFSYEGFVQSVKTSTGEDLYVNSSDGSVLQLLPEGASWQLITLS